MIYVASRASVPRYPEKWRELRDRGWPIISTWIDEAGPGLTEDFGELWRRIDREIHQAKGVVLWVEPDGFPLKGALIEIGIALGRGKPIGIYAPNVDLTKLGSWIQHPLVELCTSLEVAMQYVLQHQLRKQGAWRIEEPNWPTQMPAVDTPKPQPGLWTLTAPDGRTWTAGSPIQCVRAEQRERVPDDIAFKRVMSISKDEDALWYATRLATSIWETHYREISPDWKPLTDLAGVLTQIDNMISGLSGPGVMSVGSIGDGTVPTSPPKKESPNDCGMSYVVTDDMAMSFHRATTDGDIGSDDVETIKAGLRAVFAAFGVAIPLKDQK